MSAIVKNSHKRNKDEGIISFLYKRGKTEGA